MSNDQNHGKEPLLTVVTLAYNHGRFLREYMEGVLSQKTSFPFRVIITDDASTDDTAAIIREYAAKYPDIFKPHFFTENQFSKGRSIVKDYVIPELRKNPTKYVAFCEGDDFWTYPEKLQKQVDFLESHPDYSACYHHYATVFEPGVEGEQTQFNLRRSRRLSIYDILIERQFQLASTVIRAEVLLNDEELLSYLGTSHYADYALFLASYNAGKVFCLKEWWSAYRVHPKGISHKDSPEEIERRHIEVLKNLSKLYKGRYGRFDRMWCKRIRMRDKLAEATQARRAGKYPAYLVKIGAAFLSDPAEFIKTYYKQWQ